MNSPTASSEVHAALVRGFVHDVKNPIGAADGHLALLLVGLSGPLNEEQAAALTRARRSLQYALTLVDDLLHVVIDDTGHLDLELLPVDLAATLSEVCLAYEARAQAKDITLRMRAAPRRWCVVSDRRRIRQVIGNLLSNAIEYSSDGTTVTLELRDPERMSDGQSEVAIDITDQGPGLGPDELERLFDEFARFETSAGHRGTGVGLAISKRIAEALGGRLTVSSSVGSGTRFTLHLRV